MSARWSPAFVNLFLYAFSLIVYIIGVQSIMAIMINSWIIEMKKKKLPATEQLNRPHQKINWFMFILTLWRVKRNTYFVESHFVESVYIMYIHIYPTSRNDWIYANYLFRSATFVHANVVGNQSSFLPKAKYVVLSLIITKKWL